MIPLNIAVIPTIPAKFIRSFNTITDNIVVQNICVDPSTAEMESPARSMPTRNSILATPSIPAPFATATPDIRNDQPE